MSKVTELTTTTFEAEVNKSDTILVDFYAPWCGPCVAMSPVLDDLSEEIEHTIAKVDIDENQEIGMKYGIMTIPTFGIFKDGIMVETLHGIQTKDNLKKALNQLR